MLRRGRKLLLTGAAFIVILAFVIFVPILYYNAGCVEIYKSVSREFLGFGVYVWRYTGVLSGEVTQCTADPGVGNWFHFAFGTDWLP